MYKGLEAMEQTDSFPQTPFYMFRWTRWPMRAQRKSCRFTWRVVGSLSRTTVGQSECLVGEDFGSSRLQWMLGWVRFGADFLPDWVLQCTTNHRRTGETGERGEWGNVKQILTPLCLSVVCLPIQVSTNLVWTYLLQRDKLNWLQKVSLLRLDQSDKKTKRVSYSCNILLIMSPLGPVCSCLAPGTDRSCRHFCNVVFLRGGSFSCCRAAQECPRGPSGPGILLQLTMIAKPPLLHYNIQVCKRSPLGGGNICKPRYWIRCGIAD